MGAHAYRGRFAPSPTGPLHAGSLVAALASWLDARAHGGQWLVRLEDVDTPRCVPAAAPLILQQLATCGLVSDGPVWVQSQRGAAYAHALAQLQALGWAYPCGCSRKDIERALRERGQAPARHAERVYPGTCRPAHPQTAPALRPAGTPATPAPPQQAVAWRLHTERALESFKKKWHESHTNKAQEAIYFDENALVWHDRALGVQRQNVTHSVGDFVLKRADGVWAYQLAVVVDDAAQGITHVVRGQDLSDNTPRQLLLQHALGLPHPHYLHTPLVRGPSGEKLSKQSGAASLDLSQPLPTVQAAAAVLGLSPRPGPLPEALAAWVREWSDQCPPSPT